MAIVISQSFLLIVAALILTLSIWGMFSPRALMTMVTKVMALPYGLCIAVVTRLVLGATLIIAAPVSGFPTTFRVLGCIAIVAAFGLMLIGKARAMKLVDWFAGNSPAAVRSWMLLGLAFAVFLGVGVL